MRKKRKQKTLPVRRIAIVGSIVVAILGIIYIAGAVFFSRHFFPSTIINGQKADFRSATAMKETLTDDVSGHDLLLKEREDATETISASEIGVKLDYGTLVYKAVVRQNQWLWPKELFGEHTIHLEPDMTYDEELLKEQIKQLDVMNQKEEVAPRSAKIVLKDGTFYILREKKGNTLKKKTFQKKVISSVEKSETMLDLDEENCYKNPKYYATDEVVRKALKTAREYAKTSILYDIDGESKTLDSTEINDWVKVDSKFKVTLDDDKIEQYVEKLASEYNTVGQTMSFINHNGEVKQISGGTFGYEIDEEKEVKKIKSNIKKGKSVTRTPVYAHEPPSSSNNGYWSTYVEISISDQHMWFVKDGEILVSTDIVTGDPTEGNDTPTGAYYIFYKERNATLEGQGYASPVSYWAAFNNNVGIHDSSWRSSYGGSIYEGNGSHGCVNTPYSNAKTIWENVEVGTPVFVY